MLEAKCKIVLCISWTINTLLVFLLCYVTFYATDLSQRIGTKLGLCQYVPARADNDCVDSWNNCIKKLDMKVDVVFFGDSHTAGGDFQKAFPDVKSLNLGYIGEDIKGMLRRAEAIAAVQPKKIFLMAGINGLKDQSLSDFKYWYTALVDSIRTAVPNAELYIESILPVTASSDYCDNVKIREANKIVQHIAHERNITYIDLHTAYADKETLPENMSYDGLHLADDAYNIWYEAIKAFVE